MIQLPTITKALAYDASSEQPTVESQAYHRGRFAKMAFDYALVLPALLFIAPLFIILALLVYLESPGPIFCRRRVVGQYGRIFYAIKFRTIYVRSHAPRYTRVGAVLRQYNLDELPQLLNVLMRDMSLVGPRMMSPAELANYGKEGEKLLLVKPGLSGLWQTNRLVATGHEARVQLDMAYIDNWSLTQDIKILFQTPFVVLKRSSRI